MCKEDIRIARKKTVLSQQRKSATTTKVQVLGANPNRTAIILTQISGVVDAVSEYIVSIGPDPYGDVASPYVIGAVSGSSPVCVMDVEQYGQSIFGPMFLFTNDPNFPPVVITEIGFIEQLEDL